MSVKAIRLRPVYSRLVLPWNISQTRRFSSRKTYKDLQTGRRFSSTTQWFSGSKFIFPGVENVLQEDQPTSNKRFETSSFKDPPKERPPPPFRPHSFRCFDQKKHSECLRQTMLRPPYPEASKTPFRSPPVAKTENRCGRPRQKKNKRRNRPSWMGLHGWHEKRQISKAPSKSGSRSVDLGAKRIKKEIYSSCFLT